MLFCTLTPLVLASASPRRRELLGSLGVEFEIMPAADEPLPEPGELPHEYAQRAAEAKCDEIAAKAPGKWVLAADSVVAVAGEILGKPENRGEALSMLHKLCGNAEPTEHVVCTGCCLQRRGVQEPDVRESFVVATIVVMDPQPEAVRQAYAASQEPMDKAGAYAIQGLGGFLVREIRGSYTNVVGLPLAEVVRGLLAAKVIGDRKGSAN